jgi:hypothetical protein
VKRKVHVRPTKNRNGRHPKPHKWNEESQKHATHGSHKKCKQDKFGRKLKQSTKKAKKVECPFNLKEMKEFFKCVADFEQAKKTISTVQ